MYYQADTLLKDWAYDSNHNTTATAQVVASKLFDVPLSDYQSKNSSIHHATKQMTPFIFERTKTMLQAMQRDTAAWLQTTGATHVRLYRGTTVSKSALEEHGWQAGGVLEYDDNALASWSLSPQFAARFAGGPEWEALERRGMVVSALIPVEQILCNARTGFGCLHEQEFVVIGRREPVFAQIEAVYPIERGEYS